LGAIWVALDYDDGILTKYDGTNWTVPDSGNIHVLTIFEDHTGNMWFGTWGYGVKMWNRATNTWTTYTTENSGLPSNILWYGAIMEDADHNMWFATNGEYGNNGGLAKFDGTNWIIYSASYGGLTNNHIYGSLMDKD
jgi:ligand-binding sensor domain-containing protein